MSKRKQIWEQEIPIPTTVPQVIREEERQRIQKSERLVSVEEDGDEVFTPMPENCQLCLDKPRLKPDENGFMVCPCCDGSYVKGSDL